jgi:succinate-semialdehyde dehydrogenase/glutarate-semialdehyde dehydrogenase
MAKTISINPRREKISEYDRITSRSTRNNRSFKKEFHLWKHKTFAERAKLIYTDVLDANKEEYAQLATEMGKVIGQARKEIEKCAWCRYYAEQSTLL